MAAPAQSSRRLRANRVDPGPPKATGSAVHPGARSLHDTDDPLLLHSPGLAMPADDATGAATRSRRSREAGCAGRTGGTGDPVLPGRSLGERPGTAGPGGGGG